MLALQQLAADVGTEGVPSFGAMFRKTMGHRRDDSLIEREAKLESALSSCYRSYNSVFLAEARTSGRTELLADIALPPPEDA